MKTYAVTMYEKGYEHCTSTLNVEVGDKEHPAPKAIDMLCQVGFMVIRDWVKILKIRRVS